MIWLLNYQLVSTKGEALDQLFSGDLLMVQMYQGFLP